MIKIVEICYNKDGFSYSDDSTSEIKHWCEEIKKACEDDNNKKAKGYMILTDNKRIEIDATVDEGKMTGLHIKESE